MVGLGGATTIGAGDIFKQGLGGGASKGADTFSQYYIKCAEQYHAVIDIGAGNAVTVVFQQGFRLKTIEQDEAEKAKKEAPENQVQQTAATTAVNTLKGGSDSTVLNPDEVLRPASCGSAIPSNERTRDETVVRTENSLCLGKTG